MVVQLRHGAAIGRPAWTRKPRARGKKTGNSCSATATSPGAGLTGQLTPVAALWRKMRWEKRQLLRRAKPAIATRQNCHSDKRRHARTGDGPGAIDVDGDRSQGDFEVIEIAPRFPEIESNKLDNCPTSKRKVGLPADENGSSTVQRPF